MNDNNNARLKLYLDVSTSPYVFYQKGNPYDLFLEEKQVKYFYLEIMIIEIRKVIFAWI